MAELRRKWLDLQNFENVNSEAMDKLFDLTGIFKVKQNAFSIFKSAMALNKMSAATKKKNLFSVNLAFLGNPGTVSND